jgi:hypothetical protein
MSCTFGYTIAPFSSVAHPNLCVAIFLPFVSQSGIKLRFESNNLFTKLASDLFIR